MSPSSRTRAPRFFAVVPAAGVGSRLGAAVPKQYLEIAGHSVLERSVRTLLRTPWIATVLVVVSPGDERAAEACAALASTFGERLRIAPVGGASRRDSVLAGLEALSIAVQDGPGPEDWALVHDAARPGLDRDALDRMRDLLADDPVGGILALPVADTVKRADGSGRIAGTLPRDGLWVAQTPQMFRFATLRRALQRFPEVTDEAAAIEALGLAVRLVEGGRANFKITTAADLALMSRLLRDDADPRETREPNAMDHFRTGQGYDVHALVPGRRLVIGGVEIAHTHGLLGHSDADVLLHAITDALLGAAGLGDIGRHFPDSDQRFSGADSLVLLREAVARVREAGYEVGNVDATVVAQAPRLAPHVPAMIARIAQALGVTPDRVNVKGKTTERLGFAGRGEGIEAQAVALLCRPPREGPAPASE